MKEIRQTTDQITECVWICDFCKNEGTGIANNESSDNVHIYGLTIPIKRGVKVVKIGRVDLCGLCLAAMVYEFLPHLLEKKKEEMVRGWGGKFY